MGYENETVRDKKAKAAAAAEVPKSKSSKKTGKWCKGKVGVLHVGEWHPYDEIHHHGRDLRMGLFIQVCQGCGKHLKMENGSPEVPEGIRCAVCKQFPKAFHCACAAKDVQELRWLLERT